VKGRLRAGVDVRQALNLLTDYKKFKSLGFRHTELNGVVPRMWEVVCRIVREGVSLTFRGTSLTRNCPPYDSAAGLCRGPSGGPMGVGVFL
jgi:hypothetical protein